MRATDGVRLRGALDEAGLSARSQGDGGFLVQAEPEQVGHAALAGGVVLTALGPAEGAGLEQLFFDLTGPGAATPPSAVSAAPLPSPETLETIR